MAANVLALLIAVGLLCSAVAPQEGSMPYPAPPPLADTSELGAGIQRTMTLLATSTPERRNRVKVLFYGQSITQQDWWKEVARDLRERFPHAELVIENRALGGFAAQQLVRTAEYDLYPFYPDLVIFHVYGDHRRYEDIIRRTRQRTTAEVAIANDHMVRWPQGERDWSEFMSYTHIPQVAARYGCCLMDIRTEWRRYLEDNKLEPSALLRDGVHLNQWGCWLMAELIKRRLVYNPRLPDDVWKRTVRTYLVGRDVHWAEGRLRLEFQGNRVDVISSRAPGQGSGAAKVFLDGKRPSEFPELYYHARPSGTPNIGWPAIQRISWKSPLLLETWHVRVKEINDAADEFTFELWGDLTGPDGSGHSKQTFVSNSGRVVIEPDDWVLAYDRRVSGKPIPAGFEAHWPVCALFLDTYEPPVVANPSREEATTLVQLLPNGRHVLELISDDERPLPIQAVRVYEPPVPAGPED